MFDRRDLADDDVDPDDPEDDLERLVRALLDLAIELLRKKGRFYPFGAVLWADGEVQLAAAPTRDAEDRRLRTDAELLDALKAELQADIGAARARAVGLCTCERGRIVCHLERWDGVAVSAVLPFETRFPRRIRLADDLVEEDSTPRLFPHGEEGQDGREGHSALLE